MNSKSPILRKETKKKEKRKGKNGEEKSGEEGGNTLFSPWLKPRSVTDTIQAD